MVKKSAQTISQIVTKSISRNTCQTHSNPITTVSLNSLKLGCHLCDPCTSIPIPELVSNPIKSTIRQQNTQTQSQPEHKTQLRKLLQYKQDHIKVKNTFKAVIQQMRDMVNKFCEQLMIEYENRWAQAFEQANVRIDEVKNVELHYKGVFQELLEGWFVEGTVEEFQGCLREFCNRSTEDPYDYLNTRMQTWCDSIQNMPIIDWSYIKQIYNVLSNGELLNIHKIIKPSYKQQKEQKQEQQSQDTIPQKKKELTVLLPQITNKLSLSNFYFKYTDTIASLLTQSNSQFQNEQPEPQPQYNQIFQIQASNDTYLESSSPVPKIIGINYTGITIYAYSSGQLVREKYFEISGCLNLLTFPQCLIVEAEGRVLRVWIYDGFKEVICLAGGNIRYTENQYQFSYSDSRGKSIVHSALHIQR